MRVAHIQPRHVLLIVFFVLLASYSLYQARFLILGPQVWITRPQDGSSVAEQVITIAGEAKNVAWISLNDRQIFTDETGKWNEKLIVSKGLSIMTVKARDRFGRETERSVRIVLN